ncbi:MAG TPA: MOSC domain-containing protein [Candidatus Xenobia bacterium]|nr:MOSC domain-containing protein [Candidatus Xenobia bacterium]
MNPPPATADNARVVALFVLPRHRGPLEARSEVAALADFGLEGDAHARAGSQRQVLLIESETLNEFRLAPGALKENITTAGIALATLAPGTRLRAGEAVLEITMECTPCAFVDSVQAGLRARLQGRRGMLARVLAGGLIRVGDAVGVQD